MWLARVTMLVRVGLDGFTAQLCSADSLDRHRITLLHAPPLEHIRNLARLLHQCRK